MREGEKFSFGNTECVTPRGYIGGDVYQLFFCKCKVAVSKLGVSRRKAKIRAKRLADIVINTSS